jgi:hypothetical protein
VVARARPVLRLLLVLAALAAAATPACAQHSLGASHTAFTAPGQTITLTYHLTNFGAENAVANSTFSTATASPSCTNPVAIPANTSKQCTVTYTTTLADVAADGFRACSQWVFCDAATCTDRTTYDSLLTV